MSMEAPIPIQVDDSFLPKWALQAMVCLSAANLLFLNAWLELFPGTFEQYLVNYRPSAPALAALLLNIILTAALFTLVHGHLTGHRAYPRITSVLGVLLVLGLADPVRRIATQHTQVLDPIRNLGYNTGTLVPRVLYGLGLVTGLAMIWLLWKHPARFHAGVHRLLQILIPLPFALGLAVAKGIPPSSSPVPVEVEPGPARWPRVIVLIFDEWDYQYTFEERPPNIQLPEIDRFRATATSFSQCIPAAGETFRSIPSLMTGQWWRGTRPLPEGDLALKHPDTGKWVRHSETPDLFSDLEALNWRSSMIQWWHVFGSCYLGSRPRLSISHWDTAGTLAQQRLAYGSFGTAFVRQWFTVWRAYRAYFRLAVAYNPLPDKVQMVQGMRQYLSREVGPGHNDLVWAHLPFPHAPAVIRAADGAYLTEPDPTVTNLENMVLIDDTLRDLRQRLERAGRWDETLIILTSDHWQREPSCEHFRPDRRRYTLSRGLRVPFLVKLPFQKEPVEFGQPTSNTGLRALVRAYAKEELLNPTGLLPWMPTPPSDSYRILFTNERD